MVAEPKRGTVDDDLIYLDGFATMPLAPEARDAMLAAWSHPTNAGSPHILGDRAAGIVGGARAAIARLIAAAPAEITFTSGATEANNLAVVGVAASVADKEGRRKRIVISAVEHKAVMEPARRLATKGFEIVIAPVGRNGRVDINALRELVTHSTLLVSVMAANNETGVLQPIPEIAMLAHRQGALFHCDAAQAAGKIELDVADLGVDYMSLSAHKLYGPMGVGALYVAAGAPRPEPMMLGGGQESGRRSGTEPVPLIAGFGAAATVAAEALVSDAGHGAHLSEKMVAALRGFQVRFERTVVDTPVLPGSLSLKFQGIEADDLVESLRSRICVSTGSACTSGQTLPSHVLIAMGLSHEEAKSVLRMMCTRYTSAADIELSASLIAEAAQRLSLRTGRLRQSDVDMLHEARIARS